MQIAAEGARRNAAVGAAAMDKTRRSRKTSDAATFRAVWRRLDLGRPKIGGSELVNTKVLLACAFFALAASAPAHATGVAERSQAPTQTPDAKIDAFFSTLRDGKVGEAYTNVFAGTLMTKKQAELENLIGQSETILRYYGNIVDWEHFGETAISKNLLVRKYLLRTSGGPVFFTLTMYNNGQSWMLSNVHMTDRVDQIPQ